MLSDKDAMVTIAVKDMKAAARFYEGTLGLKPVRDAEPGSLAYKGGSGTIFVYESTYAGTNQATAVTWIVGKDLEKIVDDLRSKGVRFEHYDNLPNTTRRGDVHVAGDNKLAWFKDPDGNIHALASG
jgi:catechol 2,3-dioxygenase-like lactoylglutathione lyase family enzyme